MTTRLAQTVGAGTRATVGARIATAEVVAVREQESAYGLYAGTRGWRTKRWTASRNTRPLNAWGLRLHSWPRSGGHRFMEVRLSANAAADGNTETSRHWNGM